MLNGMGNLTPNIAIHDAKSTAYADPDIHFEYEMSLDFDFDFDFSRFNEDMNRQEYS